jgi:hypothetical protein
MTRAYARHERLSFACMAGARDHERLMTQPNELVYRTGISAERRLVDRRPPTRSARPSLLPRRRAARAAEDRH